MTVIHWNSGVDKCELSDSELKAHQEAVFISKRRIALEQEEDLGAAEVLKEMEESLENSMKTAECTSNTGKSSNFSSKIWNLIHCICILVQYVPTYICNLRLLKM